MMGYIEGTVKLQSSKRVSKIKIVLKFLEVETILTVFLITHLYPSVLVTSSLEVETMLMVFLITHLCPCNVFKQ